LGQSLGLAAGEGQQPYHLLLSRFIPRFQLQLSPGVGQRPLVLATPFIAFGQPPQSIQHQPMEVLSPEHPPLFKGRAVGQREILQERSPPEPDRLLQLWYHLRLRR
jgi:hypothetical protein